MLHDRHITDFDGTFAEWEVVSEERAHAASVRAAEELALRRVEEKKRTARHRGALRAASDPRRQLRQARERAERAEREVAELEAEVSTLTATLDDPELYTQSGGVEEATRLGARLEALRSRLDVALAAWEEETASLESLERATTLSLDGDHPVTPWVLRILIANVLLFFVQQTVPGATPLLMFVPSQVLVASVDDRHLHVPARGFRHIFFNMLALYFFGPRVEQRIGRKPLPHAVPDQRHRGAALLRSCWGSPIIGASGAVMGVSLAFAKFWPRQQVLIWGVLPIEARWLVLIYAAFPLYSVLPDTEHAVSPTSRILGGFAGALLYLLYLERRQGARRVPEATATAQGLRRRLGDWQKVDRKQHPRRQSRRGGPHPRQDQRDRDRQPHAAGTAVPLELRPAGRPEASLKSER